MGIKSQFIVYFDTEYIFALAVFDWIIFYISYYVPTFACSQITFIEISFIFNVRKPMKQFNGCMF